MYFSAPTAAPQSFVADWITATEVQLSWEPPPLEHQNGLIQSYTITVFEVESNSTKEVHQNFAYNTISLTGLHPYYNYIMSVAAYTVGLGPFASITLQTEQDGGSNLILDQFNMSTLLTVLFSEMISS